MVNNPLKHERGHPAPKVSVYEYGMAGKERDNSAGDADPSAVQDAELRAGLDYYVEDGLLVFTAEFLRKRGYCCESGCRHCPYRDRELPDW